MNKRNTLKLESQRFHELLELATRGDESAAGELVGTFETEIRRFIRFRLANSDLKQFLDSMDICQSVLAQFFVELKEGRIDLESPESLKSLLLKMAKNRFLTGIRYQHAAKRDSRKVDANGADGLLHVAIDDQTPSQMLASKELVELIRAKLPEEVLYLVEQRLDGREWSDLGNEMGTTAEAARKRLSRALDVVAAELGLINL